DLGAGRILSANPDGSDLKTIINEGRKLPDGMVLDVAARHIYWTNMGDPKRNDGSIMRSDLDCKNMITIISAWEHVYAEAAPVGKEQQQVSRDRHRRTTSHIVALASCGTARR